VAPRQTAHTHQETLKHLLRQGGVDRLPRVLKIHGDKPPAHRPEGPARGVGVAAMVGKPVRGVAVLVQDRMQQDGVTPTLAQAGVRLVELAEVGTVTTRAVGMCDYLSTYFYSSFYHTRDIQEVNLKLQDT
jgi:hypothetical protein